MKDRGRLRIAAQRHGSAFVLDERSNGKRMQFKATIAGDLKDAKHLDRLRIEIPPGDRQQFALRQNEALPIAARRRFPPRAPVAPARSAGSPAPGCASAGRFPGR